MPYCPTDGTPMKHWKMTTDKGVGRVNCYDCLKCGTHWSMDPSCLEKEDENECSTCGKDVGDELG